MQSILYYLSLFHEALTFHILMIKFFHHLFQRRNDMALYQRIKIRARGIWAKRKKRALRRAEKLFWKINTRKAWAIFRFKESVRKILHASVRT
jgi:hypothetical protein